MKNFFTPQIIVSWLIAFFYTILQYMRKKSPLQSRGLKSSYYFLCKKSGILRDLGSTELDMFEGLLSETGLAFEGAAG